MCLEHFQQVKESRPKIEGGRLQRRLVELDRLFKDFVPILEKNK